jgi:DNA-binding MarR family transcriptional regulator
MKKPNPPITNFELWLLMHDITHAVIIIRQRELTPHNIGDRQLWILHAIRNLGSKATINEIAKELDRKISVISRQTAMLEKDGLIKRIKSQAKSRLLTIELTEKGLDMLKISRESKTIDEILSILNEEERQQLHATLNKVLADLKIHIPR